MNLLPVPMEQLPSNGVNSASERGSGGRAGKGNDGVTVHLNYTIGEVRCIVEVYGNTIISSNSLCARSPLPRCDAESTPLDGSCFGTGRRWNGSLDQVSCRRQTT